MKKMILLLSVLVLTMIAGMSVSAKAAGLTQKGNKYYFLKADGTKVKNAWKTAKVKSADPLGSGDQVKVKAKFYFKANGAAATKCVKIKNTYYVFNKQGLLLNSNVTGEYADSIQKVGSTKYGVDTKGRALKGIHVVNNALYHFSENGKIVKGATAQLQAACSMGEELTALKQLLGEPKEVIEQGPGCFMLPGKEGGDDVDWVYKNFVVHTYLYDGVNYLESIDMEV